MTHIGLKRFMTALLLIVLAGVLVGCNNQTTLTTNTPTPTSVGQFSDYDAIKDYLSQYYTNSKGSYVSRFATEDALMSPTAGLESDSNTSQTTRTYSTTNNQVDGVSESDTFLTDGYYLYLTSNNKFRIIDADTLEIVFTYEIATGYLHGIYRVGNKVVLIAYEYTIKEQAGDASRDYYFWSYYLYSTKVVVFDTTDMADVQIERELTFDNTYLVQSRMIGSMLYLVLDNYQINYGFEGDDFIPVYSDSFLGTDPITMPAADIYFMPNGNQYLSYLMLVSLDIEAEEAADVKAYLGSSYQIYMSQNNLYSIVYRYDYNETTQIYTYSTAILRFAIDPVSKALSFAAVGIVAGSPLNQFSMDEYNGVFRIATTHWTWNNFVVFQEDGSDTSETGTSNSGDGEDEVITTSERVTTTITTWQNRIENQLYLLDATAEGEMTQLSKIEDIGKPGESIYAVRFNGPIAYVVTFVQTDPMYKFDLTNPLQPVELGAYYEDGVSDYLHIINDQLLLGIGRQAALINGFTRFTGVKVGLYNTEEDTPALADQYLAEGEYSWTQVGYDHKAFIYYPLLEQGIVYFAIPVFEYTHTAIEPYYWNFSQNLYIFKVTIVSETLDFVGKISHLDEIDDDNWWYWFDSIDRAVMIEDRIYTISQTQIRVHTFQNGIVAVDHLILETPQAYYPYAEDGVK
jgi:inhibitor of cysteine peptidase